MTDRTDNFNRANGSIGTPSDAGSAWTQEAGTWEISSNAAYAPVSTGGAFCSLESSVSDVDVQASIKNIGVATSIGVIARSSGTAGNCILFDWNASVSRARIYTVISGAYTSIAGDYSVTLTNADVLRLSCNGTSLKGYINGVEVLSATSSQFQTNTKHGLFSYEDGSTTFDDFSITGIGGGGGGGLPALHGSKLLVPRLLRSSLVR